jgi:hypothetical protein
MLIVKQGNTNIQLYSLWFDRFNEFVELNLYIFSFIFNRSSGRTHGIYSNRWNTWCISTWCWQVMIAQVVVNLSIMLLRLSLLVLWKLLWRINEWHMSLKLVFPHSFIFSELRQVGGFSCYFVILHQ